MVLKMLPTRPFAWATGTTFDADHPDFNRITIKLNLEDEDEQEKYHRFVQWLKYHQNKGRAKTMSRAQAAETWNRLCRWAIPSEHHMYNQPLLFQYSGVIDVEKAEHTDVEQGEPNKESFFPLFFQLSTRN